MERTKIICYLDSLGARHVLRGFGYLVTAIDMATSNPDAIRVSKVLYPDIAKQYNTTPSRVERDIRHAIETLEDDARKLPNGEFIARARDALIYGDAHA